MTILGLKGEIHKDPHMSERIEAQPTFEHETANDLSAVSAESAFANLGPAEVALTLRDQS